MSGQHDHWHRTGACVCWPFARLLEGVNHDEAYAVPYYVRIARATSSLNFTGNCSAEVGRSLRCLLAAAMLRRQWEEPRKLQSTSSAGCLLPLGDSITQAHGGDKSWRYWLWRSLLDAGISYTWVGSEERRFKEGPVLAKQVREELAYNGQLMPVRHEGHFGWHTNSIRDSLPGWAADYECQPTCALVHLGTNDMCLPPEGQADSETANETVTELQQVLEQVKAIGAYGITILLAVPIPSCCPAVQEELSPLVRALGDDASQRRFLVDMDATFEGYEAGSGTNVTLLQLDDCHPTDFGDQLMAAKWHDAIVQHCGPQPPAPPWPPPLAPPIATQLILPLSVTLPILLLLLLVGCYLFRSRRRKGKRPKRALVSHIQKPLPLSTPPEEISLGMPMVDEEGDAPSKAEWLAQQRAERETNLAARHRADTQDARLTAAAAPTWGLELVLESDASVNVLMDFCTSELSEENLKFLLDARSWRQAWYQSDEGTRSAKAQELIETYLTPGASLQVSLPSGIERDFTEEDVHRGMFDQAMQQARKTLHLDTFPRFEETDPARKLRRSLLPDEGSAVIEPAPNAPAPIVPAPALPAAESPAPIEQKEKPWKHRPRGARVSPWTMNEPAINLAARMHLNGVRKPENLMQPMHFKSIYAPGLRHFPPALPPCWRLGCPSTSPSLPGTLRYRHAVHRAACTVWDTHTAMWLVLLACLADALLLVLLSRGPGWGSSRWAELVSLTLDDRRRALLPHVIVIGSAMLALPLTYFGQSRVSDEEAPSRQFYLQAFKNNPTYMELGCAVFIAVPALVASYVLVISGQPQALLSGGDAHSDARSVGILAFAAVVAFACLQEAALAIGTAGALLSVAIAEEFTLWYVRGGVSKEGVDSWATPVFHSLCLLACLGVGGRIAYVRELWLRHAVVLGDEWTRGARHAKRLLAELTAREINNQQQEPEDEAVEDVGSVAVEQPAPTDGAADVDPLAAEVSPEATEETQAAEALPPDVEPPPSPPADDEPPADEEPPANEPLAEQPPADEEPPADVDELAHEEEQAVDDDPTAEEDETLPAAEAAAMLIQGLVTEALHQEEEEPLPSPASQEGAKAATTAIFKNAEDPMMSLAHDIVHSRASAYSAHAFLRRVDEALYNAWRSDCEERAGIRAGMAPVVGILLWLLYDGILLTVTMPGGRSSTQFRSASQYISFGVGTGALAFTFATLTCVKRAWRRLTLLGLAKVLNVAANAFFVLLFAESLVRRDGACLLSATPLFALLVPSSAYANALPPAWALSCTLTCYAVLQGASFGPSLIFLRAKSQYAELLLAESALFVGCISMLVCWQCSYNGDKQQRVCFALAETVHKQECRTAAILQYRRI